jgi:sugar phosphate isomerase/epimerase
MNIAYGFRREASYPHFGRGTNLMPRAIRGPWFKKVKEMGFVGFEMGHQLPDEMKNTEANVKAIASEVADAGLSILGIRGGGSVANPRTGEATRKRWEDAIQFASWVGSPIVNSSTGTPSDPAQPGSLNTGESVSQGSSESASQHDYDISADALRGFADQAADLGIGISVEIHQHSIFDTSWAARKIHALVDRPNFSINPDLGNIYWTWDTPHESCEQAIHDIAPISNHYWHCKNMKRVHIPQHDHAIFLQAPLPDGDIDYCYALAAMIQHGFDGTIVIEGMRVGDPYYGDKKSCQYMKELIAELT